MFRENHIRLAFKEREYMFTTKTWQRYRWTGGFLFALIVTLSIAGGRLRADTGTCGGQSITLPFTDVMGNIFFCSIAEIYFQGITVGTTPTTYSPAANVTRDQMAAFLQRTLDTSLERGSRRTALAQTWTTMPHYDVSLGVTDLGLGDTLRLVRSDGLDVWVPDGNGSVFKVQDSDGSLQGTWTGATSAYGVLCAMGRVFVTGDSTPAGKLYMIDPSTGPGAVTTVTSAVGELPLDVGFDGQHLDGQQFLPLDCDARFNDSMDREYAQRLRKAPWLCL